jgi:methyltransferase (TIGR00027 family)
MTPSRTALRVAERRAAHQILDVPLVLTDPLALRIVGATRPDERARLAARENGRLARTLRAFMAARARVAEDEAARLVNAGGGQYVILGAGLDTFAYRNPFPGKLRVFEVDQASTQTWKLERLDEAGITPGSDVAFVTVDFDVESPIDALTRAGWNPAVPTVFAWLGVTMYLERESVDRMLTEIGRQKNATVIFDYAISPELLGPIERLVFDEFAKRVASAGEPWVSSFEPDELTQSLRAEGFTSVEDLGPEPLNATYFSNRPDGMRVGSLAHIIRARTS